MEIGTIVISTARVLTLTLEELLLQLVSMNGADTTGQNFRNRIVDLCGKYYRRNCSSESLVSQVLESDERGIPRHQIIEDVSEILEFDRAVVDIAAELIEIFDLRLYCELPKDWISYSWEGLGLPSSINLKDILFIEDFEMGDPPATQVEALLNCLDLPGEQILLIDARNKFTTKAVRAGVNAILYVNPFRLREELSLRGLLPTDLILSERR